jgi:Flp pilus assembly protein TadD
MPPIDPVVCYRLLTFCVGTRDAEAQRHGSGQDAPHPAPGSEPGGIWSDSSLFIMAGPPSDNRDVFTLLHNLSVRHARLLAAASTLCLLVGCGGHKPRLLPKASSAAFRDAADAFDAGLAALDSGDYPGAHRFLEKVTLLAPDEPAAWADLGLVALRTGNLEEAAHDLEKAQKFAPKNARVQRIYAVVAGRTGHGGMAAWRLQCALSWDPSDPVTRFMFAGANERQGSDRGALQQMAELHAALPGNSAVLLQLARLAAKVGDAPTARRAARELETRCASWPAEPKGELAALRSALSRPDVRAAAPAAARLEKALARLPEYESDRDVVAAPTNPGDWPIDTFILLPARIDRIAPQDSGLSFSPQPLPGARPGAVWCGALPPCADASPVIATLSRGMLNIGRQSLPAPGPGTAACVAFAFSPGTCTSGGPETTLALAGSSGIRIYRCEHGGRFCDRTPASLVSRPCAGVWAASVDSDGGQDLIVSPLSGPPFALYDNSLAGTKRPFSGLQDIRDCVSAPLRGAGPPDIALVDSRGALHVLANQGSGRYRERPVPSEVGRVAAIAIGDAGTPGRLDLLALRQDGSVVRLESRRDGSGWETAMIAQASLLSGASPGQARLFGADLDNNGGTDIVASTPAGTQIWLRDPAGAYQPLAPLRERVLDIADVQVTGRLDLIALTPAGAPVLLANHSTKSYHWASLRPRRAGTGIASHGNPVGVGGEIRLRAGLVVQAQPIRGSAVHFGLGDSSGTGIARIAWPDGTVFAEYIVPTDQATAPDLDRPRFR